MALSSTRDNPGTVKGPLPVHFLTVRSDYFTCYYAIIKVENQQPRILRRGMFNVDRSGITNPNQPLSAINVTIE